MSNLKLTTNPKIETKFNNYPDTIKVKILALRALIIEVAQATT